MADQDRADDSATKKAHGTHGKGDAREELESPAHPEPDESEGQGRGTAAWGSEGAGGSVIDRRPPKKEKGK